MKNRVHNIRPMLGTYRLLTSAAGGFAHLLRAWMRLTGGKDRSRNLGERLALPASLDALPSRGIWLHGASVGEVRSFAPLVRQFQDRCEGLPLFVTTSTTTGRQIARELLQLPARLAPWDSPGPLRRFLDATRPLLHVIVETEIWPMRLARLEGRNIPSALVSARLSPEKWPRYQRLRSLYGPALKRLTMLSPTGDADRQRFLALGVDPRQLGPVGSLKWDAAPAQPDGPELEEIRVGLGINPQIPWVVLGSVHPGESAPVLEAMAAQAGGKLTCGVIVAPRHPQRFDLIATELTAAGFAPHRASEGPLPPGGRILLLDEMGVLARIYPLAATALLGGTLAPVGGHSPLEAAAAGCPVVSGPHISQQRALVDPLAERGGLLVCQDAAGAGEALARWLALPAERLRAGEAARAELARHQGLSSRLADALIAILESGR